MSEVDDSQTPTGWEAARGVGFKKWCGWRGSNPRPLASEANTLSTELQPQRWKFRTARIFAHTESTFSVKESETRRQFCIAVSGLMTNSEHSW